MGRHNNWLYHELKDRNNRAQNEQRINNCFNHGSILIFRFHDQVVCIGGVSFHKLPSPYAPAVPPDFLVAQSPTAEEFKMSSRNSSSGKSFRGREMSVPKMEPLEAVCLSTSR